MVGSLMASRSSQNNHTKMFGKDELIFLTATMHTWIWQSSV
jgi:hypothetical protein